ncbi:DNA-(apurinic or apyrimidinic site) endonuclease-like [Dermacentor silvarum]|uniref:DNA-(apurinic or apyrimidinic site) endonuclease-like n=1 Tax=Dermacentor silvarum TaxID=543639 RepID=UPI001897A7B4|nr:DNA-(apurinic or apyrimidinic site) endonuclease-like [Dermacentor silvarum]
MGEEHEGRVLSLDFGDFYFVTTYVPCVGDELVHLQHRIKWDVLFRDYIKELIDKKKPVVVCGDFNVAHTAQDLYKPKGNTRKPGFTKEERKAFSALLQCGFVDSFRYLYPQKTDAYTFWSYTNEVRIRNAGWRQDYFLVSQGIRDKVKESVIHNECVIGSDHCPISIEIDQ